MSADELQPIENYSSKGTPPKHSNQNSIGGATNDYRVPSALDQASQDGACNLTRQEKEDLK